MRIYCDTSFWIAIRFRPDLHFQEARKFYEENQEEELLWSPWHRVEVFNALRQFALGDNPVINEAEARQLIARLESDVRAGYYPHAEADWRDVLRTAQEISAAHAFQLSCRSADLLHVAYAKELEADLFVSFDDDQVALAAAAGLEAVNPAG